MKQLFLFLMLFISMNLFSQINTYDISKYHIPDHNYRSLVFDFDLSGNGETSKKIKQNSSYKTNTEFDSRFNLGAEYNNSKYTYNKQRDFRIETNIKPSISSFIDNNNNDKITKFRNDFNLYFIYNNRTYYKNNRYFEIGGNTSNSYKFKNTDKNLDKYESHQFADNIFLYLRHGHGRVENVTNAWIAYRIYEDLDKRALLQDANSITHEDIDQLADLITIINTERFHDYRIHRLENYKALYNHMAAHTTNNDIEVLMSLNDMYHFAANYRVYNTRLSGSRFSYGIMPSLVFQKTIKTDIEPFENLHYGAHAEIKYENYKPINEKWQRDFLISILFGAKNLEADNITHDVTNKITYRLSYYPTSRTTISSNITILNNNKYTDDELKLAYASFKWNNLVSYYLSPRVSLGFSFAVNGQIDQNENYKDNKSIDYKFSSGIEYLIF